MKKTTVKQVQILDELISNAAELPLECQNLLLMLSKGMAYTHDCLTKKDPTMHEQEILEDRSA